MKNESLTVRPGFNKKRKFGHTERRQGCKCTKERARKDRARRLPSASQ